MKGKKEMRFFLESKMENCRWSRRYETMSRSKCSLPNEITSAFCMKHQTVKNWFLIRCKRRHQLPLFAKNKKKKKQKKNRPTSVKQKRRRCGCIKQVSSGGSRKKKGSGVIFTIRLQTAVDQRRRRHEGGGRVESRLMTGAGARRVASQLSDLFPL